MDAAPIIEAPAVPNRYASGRIYKICSDLTDQVYIGSTTNQLSKRMATHRSNHRMCLAGTYHRVTSFDILQHPDAKIILVENFPCDSKEQLNARERHWIETTPNCVNKCHPGRTGAEYRAANKDVINQKHKCQCGGKFTTSSKARHLKSKKHQDWAII